MTRAGGWKNAPGRELRTEGKGKGRQNNRLKALCQEKGDTGKDVQENTAQLRENAEIPSQKAGRREKVFFFDGNLKVIKNTERKGTVTTNGNNLLGRRPRWGRGNKDQRTLEGLGGGGGNATPQADGDEGAQI